MGVYLITNLIVLESKGIVVILGMDWLSKHKVLIECAKKSIKLTTPNGKELEYVVEHVVTAKGVANCMKLNQLDANQGPMMPVVNEFPDVFPEELLGIQPDRDIEFVIDLIPGTAPIYKRPYRICSRKVTSALAHPHGKPL
jgi:hypothetical protein